jgi:hypothetical protein
MKIDTGDNLDPGYDEASKTGEAPPPILKSWRNLYLLVLGNLVLWIILFYIFTWIFR